MNRKILAGLLLTVSTVVLADSVIITDTKDWKSVPITVNEQTKTYTVEGTMPEGDFYFAYPGYRCVKVKKEVAGVNALTLHAGFSGGTDIFCYPE